jgi:hypothetical protein
MGEAQALIGEAAAESRARPRVDRDPPRESLAAQGSFRIGVG